MLSPSASLSASVGGALGAASALAYAQARHVGNHYRVLYNVASGAAGNAHATGASTATAATTTTTTRAYSSWTNVASPSQATALVRQHQQQRRVFSTTTSTAAFSKASAAASLADTITAIESGSNAQYLEGLEQQYKQDPNSVDAVWRTYFDAVQRGQPLPDAFRSQMRYELDLVHARNKPGGAVTTCATTTAQMGPSSSIKSEVLALVRAFQVSGHAHAHLDPLNLYNAGLNMNSIPKELNVDEYHFTQEDMERPLDLVVGGGGIKGYLSTPGLKLKDLIARLQETYCGTIGYEYMHIMSREQCNWLRERIETPQQYAYSAEDKRRMLSRLTYSDMFESFLAQKYPTAKRFGLEGCESFVPGIKAVIDRSSELGVESVVIGMAHRGRLNTLANVLKKPLEIIFSEFAGTNTAPFGTGDVKYHLGASVTRSIAKNGKPVHLTLCANPSHLEAVDPVVVGKVRCKQFLSKDEERTTALPILIHGDASLAGQGIVYETFGLANLHDYTVGGTVHIVINNQIGFTTNPRQSRSTPYCTDVAKFVQAPVFHVNGDDVEAVVRCCQLAAEWRHTFKKDVVVDIICYRKHGHNELDQPMFTQPVMYTAIAKHKPVLKAYQEQLAREGFVSLQESAQLVDQARSFMEQSFQRSRDQGRWEYNDWLAQDSAWGKMKNPMTYSQPRKTGVALDTLREIGRKLSSYPADFNAHKGLQKVMEEKAKMVESGEGVDWSLGESLAFGSLLVEGHHVRISGQDVERGTFSHRHAVLVDQQTEAKFTPLNSLSPKQAPFHAVNSSLSEYGVLGFEYGYSLEHPDNLVMWEGQFGDFSNGAQIMIDQFISCGEQKWLKMSGLVMLLPHGYEGQGPEHSNSRYERFLQLSNEQPDKYPDNLEEDQTMQIQMTNCQVVNCTTPANYFHVLRRQLKRDFRKPLVIATPKSLLRYKLATSKLSDMAEGTSFQKVIPESKEDEAKLLPADKIRRVVFCTGKVYYDLLNHRNAKNINDVALVRVEQLAPFPFVDVSEQLKKYKNAEVVWCQEEPQNYGAWNHAYFRMLTCLRHHGMGHRHVKYAGRIASSSPATGFSDVHKREQEQLVAQAFSGNPASDNGSFSG